MVNASTLGPDTSVTSQGCRDDIDVSDRWRRTRGAEIEKCYEFIMNERLRRHSRFFKARIIYLPDT